jgi:pyruvate kinase
MRRFRKAKIVATLGPASKTQDVIESLFLAGADVFRLNFSHGSHADHEQSVRMIRYAEEKYKRPITILIDLQGPKLRVGTFLDGKISLRAGDTFNLDLKSEPGDHKRVCLPHPEIFAALTPQTDLLLDDGRLRLRVESCTTEGAKTTVITGGELSNRKGVNVPGVMLPISALTEKDRADLAFALTLNIDWVALSFVQKPQDIEEAQALIQNKSKLMAKLEKPMAIQHLEKIVTLADGVMVARGDLGVEMPPEDVPSIQKQIIRCCRQQGKPVVVATQMLDSMVHSPSPTRAEASDVATAIYDGVDAVMLSAESAAGQYPVEAVEMMNRIITRTEQDPVYKQMLDDSRPESVDTVAYAITAAARHVANSIKANAIVTFSESGSTTLRAARERPEAPIVALTPNIVTARFLGVVWGAHAQLTEDVFSFSQMVETACTAVRHSEFVQTGDNIIVTAGIPFGLSGGTNILRVAKIEAEAEG